jgi:hypothetical protein
MDFTILCIIWYLRDIVIQMEGEPRNYVVIVVEYINTTKKFSRFIYKRSILIHDRLTWVAHSDNLTPCNRRLDLTMGHRTWLMWQAGMGHSFWPTTIHVLGTVHGFWPKIWPKPKTQSNPKTIDLPCLIGRHEPTRPDTMHGLGAGHVKRPTT